MILYEKEGRIPLHPDGPYMLRLFAIVASGGKQLAQPWGASQAEIEEAYFGAGAVPL